MGEANIWQPRETLEVNSKSLSIPEKFVAEEGQTTFNITKYVYALDTNSLTVHKNGLLLTPEADWQERSDSSFALTVGATAGDIIIATGLVGIEGVAEIADAVFDQVTSAGGNDLTASFLPVGSLAFTKGYYEAGDGGDLKYLIKSPNDPSLPALIDEMGYITIANGNIAVGLFSSPLDVRKLGMSLAQANNAPYIQAAYKYSSSILIAGGEGQSEEEGEMVKITSQIDVPSFSHTVIDTGTTVKAIGCNGFVSGLSNEFVVIEGGKLIGDFNTLGQKGVHVIGNPRSFTVKDLYVRAFAGEGSKGVKIEHGGGFTFKPSLVNVVVESCHDNYDIECNSLVLDNSFGRFSQGDALILNKCAGVVINGGGYENPTAAVDGQVGLRALNTRIMTINSTYFENNKEHNVYMEDCYAVTINSALSANITEIGTQVKLVNCEGVRGNFQIQNIDANEVGIELDADCINCDLSRSTYLVVSGTGAKRIVDLSTPQGTAIPVANGAALPNGTEQIRDPLYFLTSTEAVATSPTEALLDGKDGQLVTFVNVGAHTITIRNAANTSFWRLGVDFQLAAGTTVQLVFSKDLGVWVEV